MWARQKKMGFTIVELLIVIVVIAILAAISVVAYNGIQQRARNTQILAGVDAYKKGIIQYMIVKGAQPYGATSNICLGSGYSDGICVSGPTVGNQAISANDTGFDTRLSEFMQGKPQIGGKLVDVGGGNQVVGAYYWGGRIFYHLEGNNQSCTSGGVTSNFGSLTRCDITLPSPTSL